MSAPSDRPRRADDRTAASRDPPARAPSIHRYTRARPPLSPEPMRARAFVPPGGWDRASAGPTLRRRCHRPGMDPVRNEGNRNESSTSARPVGAPGGSGAMSAPAASSKATTPEKLERELLARLGLDPSATPEDVSSAHEAVSAYLAAAPRDLRSWARAQAAGADEAYALLTDPAALARAVALVGAGARSAVLPGGPATPPAHRDPLLPTAAAVPPTAAAAPALAQAALRRERPPDRQRRRDRRPPRRGRPDRPPRGRGDARPARRRPGGRAAGERPARAAP